MLSSTHEVAEQYAQAIFDLAQEENLLDKVRQDISFICEVLGKNQQLKEFLGNPFGDKNARKQIIINVFKDAIEPISLNFILVLIEKKIEQLLPLINKLFNALVYEQQGIVEVRVTTARELSDVDYDKIQKRMVEMLKKPVVLDKHIDKGIIGGIIIQVGDKLINGSIIRRLRDYEQLVKRVNAGEKGALM